MVHEPRASWFVDCDPGLDDALALLVIAGLVHRGEISLAGVSSVGGNAPVATTAANAASVLERAGLATVPVYAGASAPLDGDPTRFGHRGAAGHGPDGLGGLSRPPRRAPAKGTAVTAMLRQAAERPGSTLLATGPLTNVAEAIRVDRDAVAGLGRIVVLGGGLGPSPEFNWWADPHAAALVCSSGLPVDVVPIDLTRQITFSGEDAARLATAPGSDLAASLLRAGLVRQQRRTVQPVTPAHDAVAALLALSPDLATWRPAPLHVTTAGRRAGSVTIGRGESQRLRLAVTVDVSAAHDGIMRHLLTPRSE